MDERLDPACTRPLIPRTSLERSNGLCVTCSGGNCATVDPSTVVADAKKSATLLSGTGNVLVGRNNTIRGADSNSVQGSNNILLEGADENQVCSEKDRGRLALGIVHGLPICPGPS